MILRLFVGFMFGWLSGVMPLTMALAANLPAEPATVVTTTMPTVDGSTLSATCATLQAQIDAAAALSTSLTHEIILATGTLCTGPYTLPSHYTGTGWILIKGANYASLPASGTRVSLADASAMPQIQYGEGTAGHVGTFSAKTGAQRYRIIGIDNVENTGYAPNWAMIQMGYTNVKATNTGYIILDRVILRNRQSAQKFIRMVFGDADQGNTAMIDSYSYGAQAPAADADTQDWLSINNPGPILVRNSYLGSDGENFMACGGTPSSLFTDAEIDLSANTISAGGTTRNFTTGDGVQFALGDFASALPSPLAASTTYYLVYQSSASGRTTVKLSDTAAHAIAGTNIIDITDKGLDTDPTGIGSPQACTGGLCNFGFSNPGMMPQDITIKLNTFDKEPTHLGASGYLVKTELELKCGKRVLIEGNDFLNMPYNDGGATFRLTVRNESGRAFFSDVSDLTIRYNLGRNVTNWINSFGSDDQGAGYPSIHSKRWHIHDNLVYGLGWMCGGGATCGAFYSFQAGGTTCTDSSPSCKNEDVTIAHNTVDNTLAWMLYADQNGQNGLDFTNNLINVNNVRGAFNPSQYGTTFLNAAFGATWTWTYNRIAHMNDVGANTYLDYPAGTNSYPADAWTGTGNFQWVSPCTSVPCNGTYDYTLQSGSPAKNAASDGTDQGVNFTAYNAARSGASGGGGGSIAPQRFSPGINLRRAELPNNLYLTGARP